MSLPPDRDEVEALPRTGGGRGLASILTALRQLAVEALDSGHPLAAAQIAGTADRLEAQAWPLPPRPDYPPR
ncbi:hypothetical protein HB662_08515 [Roseomonas frigidaquae]|uniref:Uncharacterized protein n=1 Tax=Falsiroseomonas frigidaquae TaxID=487318 RepID=A0ABX1EXN0_9PROT|nr:hypothetical protein [Falsiroseomonas frigidaquae]NKE44818.1 hypothetical protein [Falsiroseomonas frigidaquae]